MYAVLLIFQRLNLSLYIILIPAETNIVYY